MYNYTIKDALITVNKDGTVSICCMKYHDDIPIETGYLVLKPGESRFVILNNEN